MRINNLIRFCLENPLVVFLLTVFAVGWGLYHAPFAWNLAGVQRDPVAVDAIPNLGENQQIIFTEWMGRSPRDIEDQITYPLSVALLGVPDVKTIRSTSMTGHSSIYVVFDEKADFYASRSRILEKLSSLPGDTLPADVSPTLGPDATPLGQVYWCTLEGRDPETGEALGGWNLEELRSIQDWQVRRFLAASDGVAEVAGIGGFVREYHIDADPDAMRLADVTLHQLVEAAGNAELAPGLPQKTLPDGRVSRVTIVLFYDRSTLIEETLDTLNTAISQQVRPIASA